MKDPDKNALFQAACALLLVSAVAIAQTAQTSAEAASRGSVRGTVTDASTGAPLSGETVSFAGPGTVSVKTDAEGHYTLRDVAPGQYRLTASGGLGHIGGSKPISVDAGQTLRHDFRLKPFGRISGKVLDENGEPVPGLAVVTVVPTYQRGALAHPLGSMGQVTDDSGAYVIASAPPDIALVVMVPPEGMRFLLPRKVEPVSGAPQDPKLRRPVAVLSYYPDATTPESAQTITVRPGEHREQVNIRLRRSPSYCVEGVLEKPTADTELNFVIARQGIGGATSSIGRLSGKILGSDGRIRVCDLAAAEYRLDVTANSGREVISFGSTQFSIVDRDVRNVRAPVQSAVTASGEVVLEGGQPGSPLKGDLSIALIWQSHDVDVKVVSMPGQFSSKLFPAGEYSVRATGVPEGWYLKDIAYGGTSVLNRNFRPGSVMGNTAFSVVLARDGGYAALSVTDADGKPVAGSAVTIYPAQTVSDGELADMVVSGSTDQNGRYQTAMLPPGKYYALALETPVEQTPDSMARLRGARSKAIEVTLNAGATAQVTLRPIEGY